MVTAFVATLSKAMAAKDGVAETIRVKNAATSAQARRSAELQGCEYMGVLGVERTLTLAGNTGTKRDGGYVLAVRKADAPG